MVPSIAWAPTSPGELVFAATIAAALAWAGAHALRASNFGLVESTLIVVAAPLLSSWEPSWPVISKDGSEVALNAAGFLVPLAVAAVLLATRRIPLAPTLAAVAAVTIVSYPVSVAVPEQGILLYYRVPAIAGGVVALLVCQGREAGGVAFVAAALGVVLGADLAHLPELLAVEGTHRVVLGGAGVLDGIFLAAVLATLVALAGRLLVGGARELLARAGRADREASQRRLPRVETTFAVVERDGAPPKP